MALKQGSKWSNWSWDKPVKAFIWRSSRICRPTGGVPPWFFEESLPHLLLRNNSIVQGIMVAGWVPGAELVFEATKRTGDDHGQRHWEHFSTWFAEQLLPPIPSH